LRVQLRFNGWKEQTGMAEIILVHGIDQQQKPADKLESE
jgi:hypothetical protein